MPKNEESVIVNRISEIRNLSKKASSVSVTPSKKVSPSRRKVAVSSMNLRTSSGRGGMSMGGSTSFGGGAIRGQGTNIYSPHLSTDFLELPQNRSEQRSYYRHFYNNDPYVGQAIDLHTELPLSKIRLSIPGGGDEKRNREIHRFFTNMQDRLNLLQTLVNATREYYVVGEAFIFAEDSEVQVPEEVRYEYKHEITPEGEAVTQKVKRDNWKELEEEYMRHNYSGWQRLMVLPPDQVNVESIQFSDSTMFELIPDAKTANLVQRAQRGDERAAEQFLQYPEEIRNYLLDGQNIPLGDDPYGGSFVYQLPRAKADYAQHGVSILQRCLLPGTDVLVERNGVVQCVSVEDVDERIDKVATAKGNFSTFTKGDRIVEDDIIRLEVEGQPEPLEITKEHEVYRILPEGAEELVEATQLREGDLVREVSVNTESLDAPVTSFRTWWETTEIFSRVTDNSVGRLQDVVVSFTGRAINGDLQVHFDDGTKLSTPIHDLPVDDERFLRLVGSWIGSGSVSKAREGVVWTLDSDTRKQQAVEDLDALFPDSIIVEEGSDIKLLDEALAWYFAEEFGGTDNLCQKLPLWTYALSSSLKASLLEGLFSETGEAISMQNIRFIDQLRVLASSIGCVTDVSNCEKGRCLHLVDWGEGSGDSPVIRRITNVERDFYQGPVYSFEVDTDESHSMGFIAAHNCLRSLVYKDKLRQSQTSIASRAMTPKRLIYAEDLDVHDVDELRDQVDMALMDPDFSIITNYEVRWEEISADQRLLNLSGEYDRIDRELFAGLGVTESMLTGDANYGAERINIEIINNRYMLYRDHIQRYVENQLFKPVALKKGYIEYDEFGNMVVLYPSVSFTRLAIRDNRDTFDHLFNLYQKGSLGVNYILELLNLDPVAVREGVENDMFTVNDPTFNEVVRGILSDAGRNIVEQSDFVEKLIQYISTVSQYDVNYEAPDEDGGRF